jgi:AbrB family looped-hinge helix DNA binding protein
MSTLTVTAKGQVTLHKDLLQHLGVRPGDRIVVARLPDGRIEVKAARPAGAISDVFNFLKRKKGVSLSIEEIGKVAARGWAMKIAAEAIPSGSRPGDRGQARVKGSQRSA